MKVVIIDDEPIAQQILETFSKKVPYLEVVGICDNAIEAIQVIQEKRPNLIFLDIQMPEMSGIEMLRILQKQNMMVILTTAFHEHAVESYELDVVDYLLKPISFERFLKSALKANNLYKMQGLQQDHIPFTKMQNGEMKTYVWASEGRKKVQICIEDIIIVHALKDYMELLLPDNGKVILNITMSKLEKYLTPPLFLRVNRSCIIRKNVIKNIQDMHIETTLPMTKRISIGPTYWEEMQKYITELF